MRVSDVQVSSPPKTGKTHLEYGELGNISKDINLDRTLTTVWTKEKISPKLYTTLESAISKSEGQVRVEKLIQENGGIRNMDDVHYSIPLSPTEMEHITQERELGKSYGDISESLYDRFGRTRPHHSIQYHYEKSIGKKKKRQPAQSN